MSQSFSARGRPHPSAIHMQPTSLVDLTKHLARPCLPRTPLYQAPPLTARSATKLGWAKADRQQLAHGQTPHPSLVLLLLPLPVLRHTRKAKLNVHIIGWSRALSCWIGGGRHVDGGVEGEELSQELAADPTGGYRGGQVRGDCDGFDLTMAFYLLLM